MDEFRQLMKKKETKKPEIDAVDIEGTFDCQKCYKKVDEATYDRNSEILAWLCECGAVSKVEIGLDI